MSEDAPEWVSREGLGLGTLGILGLIGMMHCIFNPELRRYVIRDEPTSPDQAQDEGWPLLQGGTW